MSSVETSVEIGAAYIRVSTNDQTELSPDAQLREIQKRAKEDGIVIPPEYTYIEEKGISGRRADNRKAFQRMIATAKSQPTPFKRLYLWKFSRFARNQDESVFYKSILRKKCGISIISVSEPIADGMFGRLIESIIEWFDEYYSFNLSGEVTRGMTEKALREGYQSTPCLGYDAVGEGKPFVINETEYAIVEFIHQQYHQGYDMLSVARKANALGYRTKRGNLFERRTIRGILTNPFYIGTVSWKDIKFQGTHETRPSVTSIFEENQQRIQSEYRPKNRREASSCLHWASGLIKCGICGASLGYNRASNAKVGRHPSYFQCWKYTKGFHEESCSITVGKLEKAIIQSLTSIESGENLNYEYIQFHSPEQEAENKAKESVKNALARVDIKELRIREAYEAGIDSLEEYKQNKERLQAERKALSQQLEEFTPPPVRDPEADKQQVVERIKSAKQLLENPDIPDDIKGAALRRVVKRIVYNKREGRLQFYYYLPQEPPKISS